MNDLDDPLSSMLTPTEKARVREKAKDNISTIRRSLGVLNTAGNKLRTLRSRTWELSYPYHQDWFDDWRYNDLEVGLADGLIYINFGDQWRVFSSEQFHELAVKASSTVSGYLKDTE